MPVSTDPQLQLDERALNHPDLEQALERHLRARDDVAEARGVVKVEKKRIDALLDGVGDFPSETALRVGRFRITKRHIEASHREFDTAPRDQISIGLVDQDGAPTRRGRGGRTAKPVSVSDDADLRPTGEVNTDALRGEAERSVVKESTPILLGDLSVVAVDRHIVRAATGSDRRQVSPASMARIGDALALLAVIRGVRPAELQAALWVHGARS